MANGVPVYPAPDGSRGVPVVWMDPTTDLPVVPNALVDSRVTSAVAAALPTALTAPLATALNAAGLGDVGTFTLTTLPDPAVTPRRTIWVTDLFNAAPGGGGGRMVSEGGFWKPIRPAVTQSLSYAAADFTVQPYVHGTTLLGIGALAVGVTRTLTLGVGSGFAIPHPGYRQRIVKPVGVLGTLIVMGDVAKTIAGWVDFDWDGSAWRQTASGGLL